MQSLPAKASLTATNLAAYHHLNCDLYLHNVYNRSAQSTRTDTSILQKSASELAKAQFDRGLEWEARLLSWLDHQGLLLRVPSMPVEACHLVENIEYRFSEGQDHFFIAGLSLKPPAEELAKRFKEVGAEPVNFGLAKPDLLEITRTENGVAWKVIDAKASKAIKTSHHVQLYFYTLCLNFLLPVPYFQSTGTAAIWLPPAMDSGSTSPSEDGLKHVNISLLVPSLDKFMFTQLPAIVSRPIQSVDWHYNPLCRSCPYDEECRRTTSTQGELGNIANVSTDDVWALKALLRLAHEAAPPSKQGKLTDIEDLHLLLEDNLSLESIQKSYPSVTKKARRILALPKKATQNIHANQSPKVEAARRGTIQVINHRNFTCPRREDVAVIISLLHNPSIAGASIESFCITTYSSQSSAMTTVKHGRGPELIPAIAQLIRSIVRTHADVSPKPTTQFYVFSPNEQSILQAHLIHAALTSNSTDLDIRLCIGALAHGASLLQTIYQPLLISGLDFLTKGYRRKAELQGCLDRLDLSTDGTVDQLRTRIQAEIKRLQAEAGRGTKDGQSRPELGKLPRVVTLKKEIERLLALPVPGYWDLPECASALLPAEAAESQCPSDEEIFRAYKHAGHGDLVNQTLERRNHSIYAVINALRSRVATQGGPDLLLNEARVLTASFLDLCREDSLRKLFFMQQFEVLAKLDELWKSRIEGCPDATVLEYYASRKKPEGWEHEFYLISGTPDMPTAERPFYDKILVPDDADYLDGANNIPTEALFDDLGVSDVVFPLNRWTRPRWTAQHASVQRDLVVADLRDIVIEGQRTKVSLQTWGAGNAMFMKGRHYRLSPRLVDFNTTKVLSALLEADLRYESRNQIDASDGQQLEAQVPFLQLVLDPKSFGETDMSRAFMTEENAIQRTFRELNSLGDESAGRLLLKSSQHRAAKRILSHRLSIIWGPPGTGKTYTITLALLRLLDVHRRLGNITPKVVFITAMTHAAIDACTKSLLRLLDCYRAIPNLDNGWLRSIRIQQVKSGTDHPAPSNANSAVHIYAGTVYQLYNFSKRHTFQVDCVIIDEAGQLSLGSIALVVRSLSPTGRLVIAGDSQQLAPIVTGQYPQSKAQPLFGSILDCIMPPSPTSTGSEEEPNSQTLDDLTEHPSFQESVVQLTENFRLNPDLGDFVSTIYSRPFKPQKVQARKLAIALQRVKNDRGKGLGVPPNILQTVQAFLIGISDVMLRAPSILIPPANASQTKPGSSNTGSKEVNVDLLHRPVSLTLIRLQTWSMQPGGVGYEVHVRAEAAIAAALVTSLRRCSPTDDIFVATPHRLQREAVKEALRLQNGNRDLDEALASQLSITDGEGKVIVDTVERLQGSEAAFVICLFSLPESSIADLGFLLERRRLNVAISRAKTLCILITSRELLRPSVKVLANDETAKGYMFLREYEERSWSYDLKVNVGDI